MALSPKSSPSDGNKLTLVVIPGDGSSMFQWRLSVWLLMLLFVVFGGLVSLAAFIVGREAKGRIDYAKATELRMANQRVATDLAHGREALVRVAKLEVELRRMLKFKTEKSLLKGEAVGGPSDEDVQHLAQLLDQAPRRSRS